MPRLAPFHLFLPRVRTAAAMLLATLMAGCASAPPKELVRPGVAWEDSFHHPLTFARTVGDDLLVVGTERHVWALDPKTGSRLWRLRNVNASQRDIVDLAESPFILINDAAGGAFDDANSYILAVDRRTGHMVWESDLLPGRILHARIDTPNQRIYAVLVQQAHGDDSGLLADLLPNKGMFSGLKREPELAAIDLRQGRLLWHHPFGDEVEMRPSRRPGTGTAGDRVRPFDLEIYHPPLVTNGMLCVTYRGVHCYDGNTGELRWKHTFGVIEKGLGQAYPNPIPGRDNLIVGDTDRLFAYRPGDGDRSWRSERFGRIPELTEDPQMLLAQVGGRYFDVDNEEWKSKGPFAVAAVDRRDGDTLWEYRRLDDSISNVLAVQLHVWVADEDHLIALNRRTGDTVLREKHDLEDPPLYVLLNRDKQIVLLSESEAAGYDWSSGEQIWYHRYPPPRPGPFKRFAAKLMKFSGSVFRLTSTLVAYGSGFMPSMPNVTVAGDRRLLSGRRVVRSTTGFLGEKLEDAGGAIGDYEGFANLSGHTQYFFTELDRIDEIALAAVDLNTGATRRLTVLPYQTADMVIDEINGLIYQIVGNRLVAVPLGR